MHFNQTHLLRMYVRSGGIFKCAPTYTQRLSTAANEKPKGALAQQPIILSPWRNIPCMCLCMWVYVPERVSVCVCVYIQMFQATLFSIPIGYDNSLIYIILQL